MILHYLKIAWRNLLKYRMQTAVSVLGLAAGFVCFALSAFWIHYEMTYDSFRRDADRLYVARVNDGYKAGKMTERLPVPMAAYLTEHYPEVESAAYFRITSERVEVDGVERKVNVSSADSAWIQLLDAQLVDGSFNFMQRHSDEVAITEEAARQWFGKESPLGKEVDMKSDGKKDRSSRQGELPPYELSLLADAGIEQRKKQLVVSPVDHRAEAEERNGCRWVARQDDCLPAA